MIVVFIGIGIPFLTDNSRNTVVFGATPRKFLQVTLFPVGGTRGIVVGSGLNSHSGSRRISTVSVLLQALYLSDNKSSIRCGGLKFVNKPD